MNNQSAQSGKTVAPNLIIIRQTVGMKKAKEIGFIPKMPQYPQKIDKQGNPLEPSEESIRGFMSRFFNWETIVNHRHREHLQSVAKKKPELSPDFVSLREKYKKN